MRGLEPPRCHHHRLLRPARLPVPPHPLINGRGIMRMGFRQCQERWINRYQPTSIAGLLRKQQLRTNSSAEQSTRKGGLPPLRAQQFSQGDSGGKPPFLTCTLFGASALFSASALLGACVRSVLKLSPVRRSFNAVKSAADYERKTCRH